jgi:thiamine-monophosphate kinase
MTEFEIIKQFFVTQISQRTDVITGIGDDAAIVSIPHHHELAITTDTLVADIHFFKNDSAFDIGYKSLAVNLSDLAAMGAKPAWLTLALTLDNPQTNWIQSFCQGFFNLANAHQVQLIGGDLTHGPLSITIQALGLLPKGQALLRSNAKPGDLIYVTGTLGDAGFGLDILKNKKTVADSNYFLNRLNQPNPRLALAQQLLPFAHAAIDISDGLAADLSHILTASQVGASINVDAIPLSIPLQRSLARTQALSFALTAGDDYELCFTIANHDQERISALADELSCPITQIGTITAEKNIHFCHENGSHYQGTLHGYRHF